MMTSVSPALIHIDVGIPLTQEAMFVICVRQDAPRQLTRTVLHVGYG